eukprot:TRINITY_DN458_c0_g1_i1.p1 TRINITY_DN458_c0_g1~~TRINITY_DN458_c0_g1_i1.p1  ORF type:complete len:669 (-),score=172.32 TRINITY_DN458_c0_g1_i1:221-2197(-)
MLLLLEYEPLLGGVAVLEASPATPFKLLGKEAAGHTFHHKILLQNGLIENSEDEKEEQDLEDTDETEQTDDFNLEGVEWKGKGKKKGKSKKKGEDLYALLGLENLRWMATEKQLKDGYKKSALKCHPDKIGEGVSDEDRQKLEDKFKRMQEAFETLSDPAKRREYDSTDDFDDTLPTECAAKDFCLVFGAAFKRQSRWSTVTPVPELGKDDTPYEQVIKFYDFWYKFKSWREFPHPDEEDVEQAECREHKRYIERFNSKLRQQGKKEESKRLREFVDNAYKQDPRILRRKQELKEEKERKKREKQEAAKKIQEDAARKIAEEEARLKAAEEAEKAAAAQAKVEREAEKRLIRKQRQKLRATCGEIQSVSEDDVETLCQSLSKQQLEELNEKLDEASHTDKFKYIQQTLSDLKKQQEEEAAERVLQSKASLAAEKQNAKLDLQKKVAEMGEWNEEELRLLDKALVKFPQGTAKRWEQVTAYVRTRTQDEVLLMVKWCQGASSRRYQNQQDWRANRKGGKGIKQDNTSELSKRDEALTDVQINTSQSNGNAPSSSSMSNDNAVASSSQSNTNGNAAPSSSKDAGNGAAAHSENGNALKGTEGEWSKDQQLAFVQALKSVGKDEEDRWTKIAGLVPGKSKVDCMKKFKEMRDSFRQKKTAT